MIFNELLYPLILFITVAIFHLVPRHWRAWWLFLSGLAFYGYYADIFVVLFTVEAVIVYGLMKRYRENALAFGIGLVLSTGLLVYYKYRNMLLSSFYTLLNGFSADGLPTMERFIFPLAISFFTFEFIHYLIDMHRGQIEKHTLQDFMAFVMFFPTMVAGPIKRFQDFVPKMEAAVFSFAHLQAGLGRMLVGLGKKIIIADSMDLWIQPLQSVGNLGAASTLDVWVALLAYAIKIYADFSGYSDIAIGSARLFGIVVPENFNYPYLRANIADFWRSWHISLTSWITDYIYILSLGGSRKGFSRTLLNTILAMGVSGIWHGAEWHFMIWGLYHGLLLALHRIYREKIKPHLPWLAKIQPLYHGLCVLITFACVTIGWGLFIMPLDLFGLMIKRLVGY